MNSLTSEHLVGCTNAFDSYLAATKTFDRIQRLDDGNFLYPEDTIQADGAVFAAIFIWVWEAIQNGQFKHYYAEKKSAFDELARIVTPNDPDPQGFTRHARFWKHDNKTSVIDRDGMGCLCRTLRNGFAHFHFRYVNEAPSAYFCKMELPVPLHIPAPDDPSNYRIFICDWDPKKGQFMECGSDTRIVETHFAHFRYHLFMFLARFFVTSKREPYVDILTGQPI